MAKQVDRGALLRSLAGKDTPSVEEFKQLVLQLENHRVLAKVFLLSGTPKVFEQSPMKYMIFREQVGDIFEIGSQDVCIVGSAKLGYSPSSHHYGKPFTETSDVDVVVISEDLFDEGSRETFSIVKGCDPQLHEIRPYLYERKTGQQPSVKLWDWRLAKEAARNFFYENFNPGLLPPDNALRCEIFDKIASTSGLFLALEPQVFVSKIRCRIFRNWRAAEDYYTNTLRDLRRFLQGDHAVEADTDDEAVLQEPPSKDSGSPPKKEG